MGNGNQCRRSNGRTLADLLTPHGEREHGEIVVAHRRRVAPNPSWGTGTRGRHPDRLPGPSPNPSWGTGTLQRLDRIQADALLLTPHGERERACASAGRRSPVRSPNPSWGTGTVAAVAEVERRGSLLTPHGERELGRIKYLAQLGRAPNPSWGTGTRSSVHSPRLVCRS